MSPVKQAWPLARIFNEMGGVKPEEFDRLDHFSNLPLMEQLALVRLGLPISLMEMAARARSAA